jgi:hypothetical protein
MEIRELAEYIVKTLVDYPDRVVVEEKKGAFASVLEIKVHKADIGMVIGKKGRTVSALRTILSAVAGKEKRAAVLEIIE